MIRKPKNKGWFNKEWTLRFLEGTVNCYLKSHSSWSEQHTSERVDCLRIFGAKYEQILLLLIRRVFANSIIPHTMGHKLS